MNINKNITIHDLALALNITASTVSRALNDNPRISGATKKRVQEMAEKMGYQPNIAAANLRKGKGNNIGVIVPRINRSFFSTAIGSIEEIARTKGYNVIIAQTHEKYINEVESVITMLNARVDGILISLSAETRNFEHLEQINRRRARLVFFDRIYEPMNASSVELNDYRVGKEVATHFLDMGAQSFGYLGGPDYINVYKNRWKGFIDTLMANNISEETIFINTKALTREKGRIAGQKLISNNRIPDAVFCVSDFAALGIYQVFRENNIAIPENTMVAGVANEPFTEFLTPGLTSVDQNSEAIGKAAVNLFFNEIEGQETKQRKKVIEPRLIIRGSTNRISNNKL